jgi:RNA polymerase sigma factor (sigma-70 family)
MLRLRGARSGVLMQQIGRLFLEGTSIGSSEGELLDRFVRARDESAFEALVARHGPMVLGVCRKLLRDPNDVDDAFQATFLVLVRKAATLRRCDLLGNWLYGVAMRVAMRARSQAARRMGRFGSQDAIEKLAATEDLEGSPHSPASFMEPESAPWLHQEVSHLPEKYRTPVVLCYFEGLTHDEAASRMGCPLGTVKGRLSRARDLLRRRLTRRGVALSAAALASQLAAPHAQAAVPAALEMATTRAALAQISNAGASLACGSSISIPVTALTEGVLHTMIWSQVKVTAGALCVAGTIAVGVVVGATQLSSGAGHGVEIQVVAQTSKAAAQKGGGSAAKSTGAASSKAQQSISPDMLSQINGTNRTFEMMLSRERNLTGDDIDRMSNWSTLMMSADLVLATGDEDRVAARNAHRDRMKKLHAVLATLPASAQNQTVNARYAQEKLEEAEQWLEQEKNQEPTPGMGGMMMRQMMGAMGAPGTMGRMGGMMGGGMMGSGQRKGLDRRGQAMRGGAAGGSGGGAGAGRAGGSAGEPGVGSIGGMAAQAGMSPPSGVGGGAPMGGGGAGGMAGMMGGGGGGGGTGGSMSATGRTSGRGGRSPRALYFDIVTTASEFAIEDKNPRSAQVRKKLEEPISMSFNEECPLDDVVKYIKQATTTKTYSGIPIYVDPHGLNEAEVTMASTVSHMDLEGIPLKTTLRLMLKQLGLAYCVRDGFLMISSPQAIVDELMEAKQELNAAKGKEDEVGAVGGEDEKPPGPVNRPAAAEPETPEPANRPESVEPAPR